MADFRKIEQIIDGFFRNAGIPPTNSGGDIYGCASTTREHVKNYGVHETERSVVSDPDADKEIVSYTELAKLIAADI